MDFPIQLFEPDGISIPIELMRFYYITTWFLSKVRNWSIPHFCKTYGIGQFHTFDENWISFKKSVKSQHFFPKVWNWPIPHFLRKVWNWSIPHFWEIFSCFPYVLTSKPSILQRRVRGGSGGFISTLWFWILLLKKCEIEIIWKWYIGKSNTISYVVNSHQLYWNGKSFTSERFSNPNIFDYLFVVIWRIFFLKSIDDHAKLGKSKYVFLLVTSTLLNWNG